MRIDELRLWNFRCFGTTEPMAAGDEPGPGKVVAFPERFTVLIGDNGAGKTTLIEALSIAVGNYAQGLDHRGVEAPGIGLDHVRRAVWQTAPGLAAELCYPARVEADGHGPWDDAEAGSRWGQTRTSARATRNQRMLLLAKSLADDARGGKALTLPAVAAYLAQTTPRLVDPSKFTYELGSRLDGYVGALGERTDVQSMARWLAHRRAVQLQAGNGAPPDLAAVLRAIEAAMDHYGTVYWDFELGALMAQDGPDGPVARFEHLSDGYRRVLGMVADIARRCAMLNPHLGDKAVAETPGVVLIDELDLHLHPKWQRTIVDSLKRAFPLIQFIATTHSPFIIQSLRPGELIQLDSQPTQDADADYRKMSPEDIAERCMGLDLPQRSVAMQRLRKAAVDYKKLLAADPPAEPDVLRRARAEVDEALAPYASDLGALAFNAILEAERHDGEMAR